jgi:hypothetical protein
MERYKKTAFFIVVFLITLSILFEGDLFLVIPALLYVLLTWLVLWKRKNVSGFVLGLCLIMVLGAVAERMFFDTAVWLALGVPYLWD